jgi:hypothetical protein
MPDCDLRPCFAGVRLADEAARAEGDAAAASGRNGLCNGQPYPATPAAPIPECPAGCARAQGLEADWKRDSHGTGMGHSSSEAFWIPQPPLVQPTLVCSCLSGIRSYFSVVLRAVNLAGNNKTDYPLDVTFHRAAKLRLQVLQCIQELDCGSAQHLSA